MLARRLLTRAKREVGSLRKISSHEDRIGKIRDQMKAKAEKIMKIRTPDEKYMRLIGWSTPASKKLILPSMYKFTFKEFIYYVQTQSVMLDRQSQRFIPERHEALGCELASIHFLLYRGGKVKLEDRSEWMTKEMYTTLPHKYEPNWTITHIDTSEFELHYEGLQNLRGLSKLTWANLSNNPSLTEWHMDRIAAYMPRLQYLDISECKNLPPRGLEPICRMRELKTLVITNFNTSAEFELTCMMLEDVRPNLKIDIREPIPISQEEIEKEEENRKAKKFWFGS